MRVKWATLSLSDQSHLRQLTSSSSSSSSSFTSFFFSSSSSSSSSSFFCCRRDVFGGWRDQRSIWFFYLHCLWAGRKITEVCKVHPTSSSLSSFFFPCFIALFNGCEEASSSLFFPTARFRSLSSTFNSLFSLNTNVVNPSLFLSFSLSYSLSHLSSQSRQHRFFFINFFILIIIFRWFHWTKIKDHPSSFSLH